MVRIPVFARIFFTPYPKRTDRQWNPPCLRFKGCRVPFPGGKNGRGLTLTTHFHIESRLGMNGAVNILGTHFCYRLSQAQGHSAARRIMSMKNSNDTIGNQTRDLPTCSAVSQPTAPPRAPIGYVKLVLRYKFVILDTYHPDTVFTWERTWRFVAIFRSQKGSASKKLGKHCCNGTHRLDLFAYEPWPPRCPARCLFAYYRNYTEWFRRKGQYFRWWIVPVTVRKKKVSMNLCLIPNAHLDRAIWVG